MKKKKILLMLILITIIFATLVGIYYYFYQEEVMIEMKKNLEIPLFSENTNLSFVKNIKNGKITSGETKIDTDTIGEKQITLEVENRLGKKSSYTFTVNVVDKEKPIIVFQEKLSTTEGKKIDLLNKVSATDNSNEDIEVSIEGEYDFEKPGTYSLQYVAKDASGNETKENFQLVVEKKVEKNTSDTFITSKGFTAIKKNGVWYIDGVLIANKSYALPSTYGSGLTKETTAAYNKMKAAAAKDGATLKLISGFRSYTDQKRIYNNYVAKDGTKKADTYSARPGHSEHQSGLAFDLNSLNTSFKNTKEGKWLNNNCYKYGFIIRYPEGKTNETGYIFEPWHLRYVGVDLATKLYNKGDWITLESYFGITSQY